jgi:hypothetical protein
MRVPNWTKATGLSVLRRQPSQRGERGITTGDLQCGARHVAVASRYIRRSRGRRKLKANRPAIAAILCWSAHGPVSLVAGNHGGSWVASHFLWSEQTDLRPLIFPDYWSPRLGILDAPGSIPDLRWYYQHQSPPARRVGGRTSDHDLAGRVPDKDVLFLVTSLCLLKQDWMRAAQLASR